MFALLVNLLISSISLAPMDPVQDPVQPCLSQTSSVRQIESAVTKRHAAMGERVRNTGLAPWVQLLAVMKVVDQFLLLHHRRLYTARRFLGYDSLLLHSDNAWYLYSD